jgi:hypothetical protein
LQSITRPRCVSGHITGSGFRTRPIGRQADVRAPDVPALLQPHDQYAAARHLKKVDLFVSRLSQLFSFLDAAELIGSLSTDIGKRVARTATFGLVQRNRRLHVQA